jgi:magnesium transporter
MIRSLFFHNEKIQMNLTREQIETAFQGKQGLLWVDFSEEPAENCEPFLKDSFGFHPLSVADALEQTHVPRMDDWGEYLYLVLHSLCYSPEDDGDLLDSQELDIFLGVTFLVTYHYDPITTIDTVWKTIGSDQRYLTQGADHLFYKLADDLISAYMPVVDEMDEELDRIEDLVFNDPSEVVLENVFAVKRSLVHLRRMLAPMREVFNKLARGDDKIIEKHERVFFRDIYDHLVRLYDITESLRDLMAGVLDTYLSVINQRMNEVMKTLTIIATIFMPLSFIVGFFGMNFFAKKVPVESFTSMPVFYLVLFSCIAVPVGMYVWMRSRKWM